MLFLKEKISPLKQWIIKNEKYISPGALIFGFILDSLTLRRVDLLAENFVFIFYLFIALFSILFINFGEQNKGFWYGKKTYLFFLMQFAFGGLFSGFFIFYSRSSSFTSSWPFLIILGLLLLSTEFTKNKYQNLSIQLSVFFLALYSFFIFYIPTFLRVLSPWIFVLSTLVSLVVFFALVKLLSFRIKDSLLRSKKFILRGVFGIVFFVNIFYFLNIIPPIPLSLKDSGVFHNVSVLGKGEFVVYSDRFNFFEKILPRRTHIFYPGEKVYFYSAVFSPTDLNINIVHNWEYFDKEKAKWISSAKIKYPIVGGRDGGYRGYSFKSNIWSGLWRVSVETERGAVIGRKTFNIEINDGVSDLIQIVK